MALGYEMATSRKILPETLAPSSAKRQTALVTGASAGIGRELVRQLVRGRGMTVLATARRRDRLEALAAELPAGSIQILEGDLADEGFRKQLWEHAESLFPGGIDLLVNNAGFGAYGDFEDQDPATWRGIIELNVIALMDLSQRALRHMKARKSGQILEISSVLGWFGLPLSAVYVASKHAVNGFVESLRHEARGTGVRVWAACPGRTESEFARVAATGAAGSEPKPTGEPTDKVVRAIVRGLDGGGGFLMPTWSAWWAVKSSRWFPGTFRWLMGRVGTGIMRKEIAQARQG